MERIKGQEFEVLIIAGGVPQDNMIDIKDFEMEVQLEVLREGYLGETTDRRDSVYRGCTGRVSAHFENGSVLSFMRDVVDKARRREPGTKFNLKGTLLFPSGERPIVLFPDVSFGAIPLNFGGREQYGTITLPWECSDFKVLSI